MTNLMRSSIFPGVCIIAAVVAVLGVLYVIDLGKNSAASVEIGLAELSPKGEEGGYGVPASGSSAPSFSVRMSPTSVKQGKNAKIRWDWQTTSSAITRVTISRCNQSGRTLQNCSSWTEVIRMNGSDFGGGTENRTCQLLWITWSCPRVVTSGPSSWYNAKSSGLKAGNYVYRGVARFENRPSVTASATLRVTGAPAPAALPDLTAVNLSHTPSNARVGDTITIQGQIRNSGTGDAGASTARICINSSDCVNRAVSGLTKNGGTSSMLNRTWTPSAAGTYTVRLCGDSAGVIGESNESNNCGTGSVASYSITVSPRPANPVATLEVRNITTGYTTGYTATSPFNIVAGHNIELKWRGTDADSCRGVNFNTGGSTNDSTTDVNEPALGETQTFEVICSKAGVEDRATIAVIAVPALPTLEASKNPVLTGEPFTLTWNLNGNDPAQCTISGPGADDYESAGDITVQNGTTEEIEAIGTATYTLDCPAGDATVDIQVLPQVYES